MLHECPVALFGGSTESVRLRVKSLGQGWEQTKDLINRYFDRLLRNLKLTLSNIQIIETIHVHNCEVLIIV